MPNDKRTRSIRESLKNTLKHGGRYATGTAKLFLASGKDMFTAEMPTVTGMFDVNKELLQDAVSQFFRRDVPVKNYIGRFGLWGSSSGDIGIKTIKPQFISFTVYSNVL